MLHSSRRKTVYCYAACIHFVHLSLHFIPVLGPDLLNIFTIYHKIIFSLSLYAKISLRNVVN